MASHLPIFMIFAVLVVAAFLMVINFKRDTRAILQKQFPAPDTPDGPMTVCELRFPLAEVSTPCVAHASKAGLFMVSTKEEMAKWRWVNNVPYLKQPVFIPWSRLDPYRARFPMRNWVRFDIRGTKATFFMRQDPAVELLRIGAQPLPSME
jgi:hypothetical protein